MNTTEFLGENKPVNQMQPLVSVCITAYQHASYIEKCLEGALKQQCDFPYEILLGEDESNDGTREICQQYAEKYPDKIRLFLHSREDNYFIAGGATGKNNFIYNIKQARGEYIALCDGDDFWLTTDKLQTQVEALKKHPQSSISFHKVSCIDDTKGDCGFAGDFGEQQIQLSADVVIGRTGGAMPMNSIMIRRNLTPFLIEYCYKASGMHFFLQALGSALSPEGALYLPKVMGCYRRNSASSVTNTLFNTRRGKLEATKRNLRMLDIIDEVSPQDLKKTLARAKKKIVKQSISSGLIAVKDFSSLCSLAQLKCVSPDMLSAIIKSFRKKLKHSLTS